MIGPKNKNHEIKPKKEPTKPETKNTKRLFLGKKTKMILPIIKVEMLPNKSRNGNSGR